MFALDTAGNTRYRLHEFSCTLNIRVKFIWASSWDYGTYHIGDQQRFRRAWASAQSHQSLRCSHTLYGSRWKVQLRIRHLAHWMAAHAPLKNEFTEDEMCHNLMRWPIFRRSCQWRESADISITRTWICQWSHIIHQVIDNFLIFLFSLLLWNFKWAAAWQNQQNGMCAQRRLRSAWASAQSLITYWVHSEDWSDWADAKADRSLRWAHMSFCWFCREAAQIVWTWKRWNK